MAFEWKNLSRVLRGRNWLNWLRELINQGDNNWLFLEYWNRQQIRMIFDLKRYPIASPINGAGVGVDK